MSPLVVWPSVLGLTALGAGLFAYRVDLWEPGRRAPSKILALGPVFVAAALATFAGEHFTQARQFSALVPKWLPFRVPLTYIVGVCLLAAALSLVARRAVRWSPPLLAVLFALFVLLIYLPSAIAHPGIRIVWIFPFREGTFAVGAFCLSAPTWRSAKPRSRMTTALQLWTAVVVIFFGLQNILYPQFAPGVPSQRPTSAWVPMPHVITSVTGVILIALGAAILIRKLAATTVTAVGILMTGLTVGVFAPDLILARGVADRVIAINFVADTLLFAGMMFAVAKVLSAATAPPGCVILVGPAHTIRSRGAVDEGPPVGRGGVSRSVYSCGAGSTRAQGGAGPGAAHA